MLFLNDTMCGGGAEKSMALIIKELSKKNKIFLVSLDNKISFKFNNNVEVLSFNKELNSKVKKFFSLFKDAYKLSKFVKGKNIKKVVSFQYRSNLVNILSKKIFASPHKVIVSERNYPEKSLNYNKLFKLAVKFLYKKADLVIVNSTDSFNLMKKWDIENVEKIFNGYDKQEICKLSKEEIEINKDKKVIINVGRLTYQKGQKYLIEALRFLPDFELWLVGKGEDEKFLKELVNKYSLEKRVKFLGFQTNPYKFVKNADIFAFTSLYEGFPNALAEAIILQKPIACFNFKAGANDLIDEKELVKIGDIEGLVERIKHPKVYPDKTLDIKEVAKIYEKVLND
jgi:glycosyltransferase involved in cell wall biosynthesis